MPSAPMASDRRKHPAPVEYTFATRDTLFDDPSLYLLCKDGKIRPIRWSGRVRTWKRSPDRVERPVKFGMYESATAKLKEDGRVTVDNGCYVILLT